jgi:hypothetical protein
MITEQERDAIAKAIPAAGVEVPDYFWRYFWRNLEMAIDICRTTEQHRTARPPARERKRWQRIEKLTDDLAAELRAIRLHISADGVGSFWPNRALRALWPVKYRAESAQIGYEMLGHGYGGRSKPHRDLFYRAICDLWIDLGEKLQTSTSSSGKPTGPLIRFFQACARPAVGDLPAETVASIIDRERARRERMGF